MVVVSMSAPTSAKAVELAVEEVAAESAVAVLSREAIPLRLASAPEWIRVLSRPCCKPLRAEVAEAAAPTDSAVAVIVFRALPRVSRPPSTVRLARSVIPEVVTTPAVAVELPRTESAVALAVVVAMPLTRPAPSALMVLFVAPDAARASLYVTEEVPLLGPFTEVASASELAVDVP